MYKNDAFSSKKRFLSNSTKKFAVKSLKIWCILHHFSINTVTRSTRKLFWLKRYLQNERLNYFNAYCKSLKETRGAVALRYSLSMRRKKHWWNTPFHFQKETDFWQESLDGELVGRIQAGSFKEIWVLGSTKHQCQINPFAFSNHQNSNRENKIKDCSF